MLYRLMPGHWATPAHTRPTGAEVLAVAAAARLDWETRYPSRVDAAAAAECMRAVRLPDGAGLEVDVVAAS